MFKQVGVMAVCGCLLGLHVYVGQLGVREGLVYGVVVCAELEL